MNLENYIKENRTDFDVSEPSELVWKGIDATLKKNKRFRFNSKFQFFTAAASLLICLGIGFWVGKKATKNELHDEIASLSPKYATEMSKYTQFIVEKREELKQIETENSELANQFQSELVELEKDYQGLKNLLPKNPNQEELIQAMLRNLKWQVEILNRQLEIIQKIKEDKEKNELV